MNTAHLRIVATTNDWDAPVLVRFDADNKPLSLAREIPPGPLPVPCAVYPHAVVYVDGEMTRFDAARQPDNNERRTS